MTELDDLEQSLDKLDQKTCIKTRLQNGKFIVIDYKRLNRTLIDALLKHGYVVSSPCPYEGQTNPGPSFVRKVSAKSNKVERECPECGGDGKIVEETTELAFEK